MSYRIDYNEEQDYIAVTVEGKFTLSTLKELSTAVATFTERYNCRRILNDMRHARLTEGTLDIYNMPKIAREAGVAPPFKRAILISEFSANFHFLETVFLNQGHIVKLFTDTDQALHWLLNEETPKYEPSD